jgi:5-methylcytosine-specific restriction endonuclease McrA
MATRKEHAARPGRESLSKRLGKVARQIKMRDNDGRCVYCNRNAEESGAHMHLDHLTPKHHGGLDLASNLVTCCRAHNSARKDMVLPVWAAWARENLSLSFTAEQILAQAAKPLPAL